MIYTYDTIWTPELRNGNFHIPLVPVHLKVGTHASSVWLVRKADLGNLQVGGLLKIFSERNAHPVHIEITELRGNLWFATRI